MLLIIIYAIGFVVAWPMWARWTHRQNHYSDASGSIWNGFVLALAWPASVLIIGGVKLFDDVLPKLFRLDKM